MSLLNVPLPVTNAGPALAARFFEAGMKSRKPVSYVSKHSTQLGPSDRLRLEERQQRALLGVRDNQDRVLKINLGFDQG